MTVPGEGQTDFVPEGCAQGEPGVRRPCWTAWTPAAGRWPLAVGDGPADLDLLDLADRPFLPRHARSLARPRHEVARRSYQAGLADAVADLLGHAPGGCRRCAVHLTPANEFVLAVLSLKEAGPRGIPTRLWPGSSPRRGGCESRGTSAARP